MRQNEAPDNLSPAQATAVQAMLAGKTVTDAAAAAGVGRTTVHRWLKDDFAFQAELNRGRREMRRATFGTLERLAAKAADCLGHVYIVSNIESFGENVYKIGLTRRWNPQERVDGLGGASVPFDFDVHAMILSDDAPALERQLHRHFVLMQMNKANRRREFFRVCLKQIREEIERLGLTSGVQWTMTAEAREYRETLATEKAIKDDPKAREDWIKRQLDINLTDAEILDPVAAALEDE